MISTETQPKPSEQQLLAMHQAIDEFLDANEPESVTLTLWQMFIATVSSEEFDNMSRIQRSNLAFMYRELNEFIIKLYRLRQMDNQ